MFGASHHLLRREASAEYSMLFETDHLDITIPANTSLHEQMALHLM